MNEGGEGERERGGEGGREGGRDSPMLLQLFHQSYYYQLPCIYKAEMGIIICAMYYSVYVTRCIMYIQHTLCGK